jgi:hypothetical protein
MKLLRQLVANSSHDGNGARNDPAPAQTTYSDFTTTHSPIFTEAGEPLEVDHWIRVIESKFGFLRCTEVQKTLIAKQQMRGDASTWWANYTDTRLADYQVSWTEFFCGFRTHYIPVSMIRRKRQEFMDLKQGGTSVHNYSKLFNHLAQYALDQVDTDEKKKDRFMIGLSTKLQERMAFNTGGTFSEFVSNVIIMDDAICAHKKTKKRKVVAAPSGSAPPKYRTVYNHGSMYPPHQQQQQHQHQRHQQQWAPRSPQRPHQPAASKALPPPLPVLCLPVPPTAGAASDHTCFNYGCSGHFARLCLVLKKNTPQGHVTYPSRDPQKVVVAKTGRVNYTTMEDVPEGELVLAGMFSLNGHPIVVLFYSGVTHNFISKACTKNCRLTITNLSTPYMISTPEGKMVTQYLAKNTPLNLAGNV